MSRKSTKKRPVTVALKKDVDFPVETPLGKIMGPVFVKPPVTPEPEPEVMVTLDEAAIDLDVSARCALLWFDNGHLKGTDNYGFVRVSRRSIENCRKRFLGGA